MSINIILTAVIVLFIAFVIFTVYILKEQGKVLMTLQRKHNNICIMFDKKEAATNARIQEYAEEMDKQCTSIHRVIQENTKSLNKLWAMSEKDHKNIDNLFESIEGVYDEIRDLKKTVDTHTKWSTEIDEAMVVLHRRDSAVKHEIDALKHALEHHYGLEDIHQKTKSALQAIPYNHPLAFNLLMGALEEVHLLDKDIPNYKAYKDQSDDNNI